MSGVSRTPVSKKNSYAAYFDRSPIQIAYDTIRPYPPQPIVYNGAIPPPPPLPISMQVPSQMAAVSPTAPSTAPSTTPSSIPLAPPSTVPIVGGTGPIVYDASKGNIPPPPPLPGNVTESTSTATATTSESSQPPLADSQPIKYNFDYESTMTEEDLVLLSL